MIEDNQGRDRRVLNLQAHKCQSYQPKHLDGPYLSHIISSCVWTAGGKPHWALSCQRSGSTSEPCLSPGQKINSRFHWRRGAGGGDRGVSISGPLTGTGTMVIGLNRAFFIYAPIRIYSKKKMIELHSTAQNYSALHYGLDCDEGLSQSIWILRGKGYFVPAIRRFDRPR